jgi:conjugal transfer pilus assembly protein TraW
MSQPRLRRLKAQFASVSALAARFSSRGLCRFAVVGALAGASVLATAPAWSSDLGIEGTIYEPIEEDLRITMMRLVAAHDWSPQMDQLKDAAQNYSKNLPSYILPKATMTKTRWKDVGVVATEDIYLPWVDWKNGSVLKPGKILAIPAGTYANPILHMQSVSLPRMFIFDATDPDQLEFARALMAKHIPNLNFILIAGDAAELGKEMDQPVFHAIPTMLQKFHVEAVPTLIGFGKGPHQGHMALTELAVPGASLDDIQKAWFGLPYSGYDPSTISDEVAPPPPEVLPQAAIDALKAGAFQPSPEAAAALRAAQSQQGAPGVTTGNGADGGPVVMPAEATNTAIAHGPLNPPGSPAVEPPVGATEADVQAAVAQHNQEEAAKTGHATPGSIDPTQELIQPQEAQQ